MPEAFAVLFVLGVCLGVYLFARVQASDPARRDPAAEVNQLRTQQAWLQERLQRAEREGWGADMRADLAGQLQAVSRALSAQEGPSPKVRRAA